jgi:hypothetical protein
MSKSRPTQDHLFGILPKTICLALLTAGFLVGCGGGSSSNAVGVAQQEAALKRGQFIDSAVSGVSYQTSKRSGTTDANGFFEYDIDGEPVTFSLGNTVLGSASSASVVHVFDVSSGAVMSQGNRGQRVAQLLQTLDEDGNPANGIQISATTTTTLLSQPQIDFEGAAVNWQSNVSALAALTNKSVVSEASAIAHATSNLPNCSIVATTYPYVDNEKLGTFSTEGRTCDQRARAVAFYDAVYPQMRSEASAFRNSIEITNGEQVAQEAVERLAKDNLVTNVLKQGIDFLELSQVEPKTAAQTIGVLMSATGKLGNDAIIIMSELCGSAPVCKSEAASLEILSKAIELFGNSGDCLASRRDKCAEYLVGSAELMSILDKYFDQPSNEKRVLAAKKVAALLSVLFDATEVKSSADLMAVLGSTIDLTIKATTNFYNRDSNAQATRSGLANAFEITGEAIKTATACVGANLGVKTATSATGELGKELFKAKTKCAKEVLTYLNSRAAEISAYISVTLTASDLNQSASNYEMAADLYSEILHYNGLLGAFRKYGISQDPLRRTECAS